VPLERVYIISGGNRTVTCSATGDPTPNLEWSRNPRIENYLVSTRGSNGNEILQFQTVCLVNALKKYNETQLFSSSMVINIKFFNNIKIKH